MSGSHARALLNHRGVGGHHSAQFLRNHAVPGLAASTAAGALRHGHHHRIPSAFVGFGYPFWPFYSFWPYGYGFGYSGYGYGYGGWPYYRYHAACSYVGYGGYSDGYSATVAAAPPAEQPLAADIDSAKVFAEKGEADFRARDYKSAAYAWRHAVLDDPTNGVLLMLLAQSLFATEQFDEAAGATQQAMQLLSEDQWGVVVTNYKELYSRIGDYTRQLRALEKAAKGAAGTEGEAGLRFLLGFHYGYLGYPSQSVKQLDKVLELAATDQMAQKLRELMAAKLATPGESPSPAGDQPPTEPAAGQPATGEPDDGSAAAETPAVEQPAAEPATAADDQGAQSDGFAERP